MLNNVEDRKRRVKALARTAFVDVGRSLDSQ